MIAGSEINTRPSSAKDDGLLLCPFQGDLLCAIAETLPQPAKILPLVS